MVSIAVCGVGVWGRNFVKNFYEIENANLAFCYDQDERALAWVKENFPQIEVTSDFNEILKDKRIDAVVVATPAATHFEIGKKALEAGKNVLIEKPLTLKSEEAEVLLNLAQKSKKKLMVGHLLKYHPAVLKMKSIIEGEKLGKVLYINSQRLGLGRIREVENVMWCLGVHDVYLAIYLLGMYPEKVAAFGKSFLQKEKGIEEVVSLNLFFENDIFSHIYTSWLNAEKKRITEVVCEKGTIVFDEVLSSLKIYRGEILKKKNKKGTFFEVKKGEEEIVEVEKKQPLKEECLHFINCIEENKTPLTDGKEGLHIVRVLEVAQKSLKEGKILDIRF